MSQYQRRPVVEFEFGKLVSEYYEQKQVYNDKFEALLKRRPLSQRPSNLSNMPVHHSEENASGNLTDQVAKESKDSTASSHHSHNVDTGAKSAPHASVEHHNANPGLVQATDLPEPASKEELKKRAEELNK